MSEASTGRVSGIELIHNGVSVVVRLALSRRRGRCGCNCDGPVWAPLCACRLYAGFSSVTLNIAGMIRSAGQRSLKIAVS